MATASSIRAHIHKLGCNKLITTRELLHCGSRHTVDQALHTMVKRGKLIRWTSGVFSLPGSKRPTPEDLATTKARSRGSYIFGEKSINTKAIKDQAQKYKRPAYLTSGSNSSFKFGKIRVYVHHACSKTLSLLDQGAIAFARGDLATNGTSEVHTAVSSTLASIEILRATLNELVSIALSIKPLLAAARSTPRDHPWHPC